MSTVAGGAGLDVSNLVTRYGTVLAVNDVSFHVAPGEFVSLLGPSGCGKTTTLRCIAGFERPDQGRISIDGETVTDAETGEFTPPNRRHFGMVFQSYAIWPHMSVMDNVAYPLRVRGGLSRPAVRERTLQALTTVGLGGFESRFPTQLSGGQQQRVALARALVMEPRLLLFDEPLSNLDAKLRERMRFELIEIQSALGIPAVYVTHDQAEAMVMSSRVIVMERGEIAQEGSPEQIYARPRTRFVADFIGLSNFLDAEIVEAAEAGQWRCRSVLGAHRCRGSGDHHPGQRVVLAIRPERIELGQEPFPEGDGFRATVQGRYFLGPYVEYFLELGEQRLRVQRRSSLSVPLGGQVHARVHAEDCQIVASDGAPSA
ncbi:MAG: ABC transporter ATP-binding protein [Ectothiorhodospiraceae bacterium]|nr:ABC transporter ATP-binding protein [Ectothiorhodospiraceae bacterium]